MLDGLVGAWETRADYGHYLQGIADFRISMDQMLAGFEYPPEWGGFRPVDIHRELNKDLSSFGLAARRNTLEWTGDRDREELLGLLYTLEGSNLGAQILLRRATALGFSTENGCAHLARQAAAIGNWRQYLDLLENTPDLDMDRVGEAACIAFDLARQSFERVVCERC